MSDDELQQWAHGAINDRFKGPARSPGIEVGRMPNRIWRAIGAVTALAMTFGMGPAHAAETTDSLHYDESGKVGYPLDQVVGDVRGACITAESGAVTVEVKVPTGSFTAEVPCDSPATDVIENLLVDAAAPINNAAKKAAKVIAVQASMPATYGLNYDRSSLVWDAAAGGPDQCKRVVSRHHVARMSSGLQHGETAESWTLVEAVRDAGLCPDQLPDLYRAVSDLGHPGAVQAVKHLMDPQPVTIPLKSIPKGVSARAVDERSVFLMRGGKHVTTYLTNPHGTPGLQVLWWCPKERVFVEPTHAGVFNANGAVISGPASRGLDRFATRVNDGAVTVDLRHVIEGSPYRQDTTAEPGSIANEAWNTNPNSFCFMPLVGGQS